MLTKSAFFGIDERFEGFVEAEVKTARSGNVSDAMRAALIEGDESGYQEFVRP